jgi:hypothetical protein
MIARGDRVELRHPLQLREEQGGIAGTSVSTWTVEPSGPWSYTEALVRGGKEVPESRSEKKGTLTQEQLASLARVLAAEDLAGLPAQIGAEPSGVNPHSYTLTFGKVRSTVAGVAARRGGCLRANILEGTAEGKTTESSPRLRFAKLAQALHERLQAPK